MTQIMATPVSQFARSNYSQHGEDGILEELLRRIESRTPLDRWCVEFGALDGIRYSNTYNLIKESGYRAVLIEGDKRKYKELCKNIPQEHVTKLCRFVTLEGRDSLDNILRSTRIPTDFDFLSINIDGCDYRIFKSLNIHKPKIICIEFNPNIPNEIEFVQPADFSIKQGSSARSTILLAAEKGYFLAACTPTNLIFVRNEFRSAVGETTIEEIRDDAELRTFVYFWIRWNASVKQRNNLHPVAPVNRLSRENANNPALPEEVWQRLQRAAKDTFRTICLVEVSGGLSGSVPGKDPQQANKEHRDVRGRPRRPAAQPATGADTTALRAPAPPHGTPGLNKTDLCNRVSHGGEPANKTSMRRVP